MRVLKKLGILLFCLLLMTSCNAENNKNEKNEFQELYNVKSSLVKSMSYEEFLEFTNDKSGVVFIGDDSSDAKDLASIFCDNLCECDVNKAHFVQKKDIKDNQLLNIFNVKELNYPVIVAYHKGKLVAFYDTKTKTDNVSEYIHDLIMSAYPTVCTEAC